jgi:hypothetical protein
MQSETLSRLQSVPSSYQQHLPHIDKQRLTGCHHDSVQVDFLSGEYGGTGKKHRHQVVVPCIVMKGIALYGRMKEKNAWDIYTTWCWIPAPIG